jgi:hypothetical protein
MLVGVLVGTGVTAPMDTAPALPDREREAEPPPTLRECTRTLAPRLGEPWAAVVSEPVSDSLKPTVSTDTLPASDVISEPDRAVVGVTEPWAESICSPRERTNSP